MLNRSRSMTTAVSMLAAFALSHAHAQSKWQDDAPGRAHRIDVTKLPAPFATESARQFPRITPKPDAAQLKLPPGFKVEVFTRDVEGPRVMRIAPNGDIFVAEEMSGRVKVLRRRPTALASRVLRRSSAGLLGHLVFSSIRPVRSHSGCTSAR